MTAAYNFERGGDESPEDFRCRVINELADAKVLMPPGIEMAVANSIDDNIRELIILREPTCEPWHVVKKPWLN